MLCLVYFLFSNGQVMSCVFPAYHSSFNGANYLLVKIMEIIKWSETSQLSALIRVCHINIFILFKKKKNISVYLLFKICESQVSSLHLRFYVLIIFSASFLHLPALHLFTSLSRGLQQLSVGIFISVYLQGHLVEPNKVIPSTQSQSLSLPSLANSISLSKLWYLS